MLEKSLQILVNSAEQYNQCQSQLIISRSRSWKGKFRIHRICEATLASHFYLWPAFAGPEEPRSALPQPTTPTPPHSTPPTPHSPPPTPQHTHIRIRNREEIFCITIYTFYRYFGFGYELQRLVAV